ncbi:homeodomain-like protein [Tanacetum coccineum]
MYVVQIVLWYLDSGCSKHMTGNRSQLKNFMKKFIETFRFENDHFGAITSYGDYVIDLEVAFKKHSCYVQDVDGVELLKGSRGSNLYTISIEDMSTSSPFYLLSKASKNKSWLWHRRLNHLNFAAQTMLIFSKALMFLRAKAVATAFFGALCYPTNDSEDLGKFKTTADIGIFLTEQMAPVHISIVPEPILLTPGQISSGLVPDPVPAASYVPPTNKDLEILFQPIHSPSSLEVQPPIVHQGVVAGLTIEDNPFAQAEDIPFINMFALEPSSKESSSGDVSSTESNQVIQPHHHLGKWSKDHPMDNIIGRYGVYVPTLTKDHKGNKTNTPYPGKAIRRIQAIWELNNLEDIKRGIGKFVFLVDFIILDMPEDIKVPLILERPFLSIAHAKINVYKRKITLRIGKERIIFKSIKPASSLIKRVYMLSLRERMELDLEARLMGETLLINRSLDPFNEDYIELNDLNEPFELRINQGDDLMPTIEEGFEFTHANFFPLLYVNVMSKKFHYSIMKDKMVYKGNDVVGALMNAPIFVGTFFDVTDFAVLEDMGAYCDEGMGDVIFGEPFLREVGIKERRFEGMITIYDGNDSVTYQMVRSHLRFKHHTNEQCNKILPLLKVSDEDKRNGISHSYQKLKGFYKGVLNLGPDYIRDVKTEEWLTRGHISVHEME